MPADEATMFIEWVYANPGMPATEYAVELAKRMEALAAEEYERGKQHGDDDRKMIERQNQANGREIDRLKSEIGELKKRLYLSQPNVAH